MRVFSAISLFAFIAVGTVRGAHAYSQYGGPIPQGHEFLIAESGKLVQARFPALADARRLADTTGCGLTCRSFGTKSPAIWSAVYGNRWIDIMGFRGGFGWYRGDETKCLVSLAHLQNQLFDTHFTRSAGDLHRHAPASFSATGGSPNGDNIFQSLLKTGTVAGLKPLAKAALDASVDLWVAFMQARADKPRAGALLDAVIAKWLQWDRTAPSAYSLNADERADCAKFLPDYNAYNARRIRNCYRVTGFNTTPGFTDLPPFYWKAPLLNWPNPDRE